MLQPHYSLKLGQPLNPAYSLSLLSVSLFSLSLSLLNWIRSSSISEKVGRETERNLIHLLLGLIPKLSSDSPTLLFQLFRTVTHFYSFNFWVLNRKNPKAANLEVRSCSGRTTRKPGFCAGANSIGSYRFKGIL